MQHPPELLDKLRQQLTRQQRLALSAIWEHYLEHGEWMPARLLHHRFNKKHVRSALEPLGGSVLFRADLGPRERYGLSFLGALLTMTGEPSEDLLAKYLEQLRNQFMEQPERETVTSKEIEAALNLDTKTSWCLYRLIQVSNLSSGTSSHDKEEWSVGVPYEIDDLPDLDDLRAFIRTRALAEYNPSLPVDLHLRHEQASNPSASESRLFSFVRDTDLRRQLESDWTEANSVHTAGAWKSCIVLCGGILEGALLDALMGCCDARSGSETGTGPRSDDGLKSRGLAQLIKMAETHHILSAGSVHLSHALREFRNLVHPGRQKRRNVEVTQEEADLALDAVTVLLRELSTRRG